MTNQANDSNSDQKFDFMSIDPSTPKEEGEDLLELEDVLKEIKPFKLVENAIKVTGGIVNNKSTHGDVDIYIKPIEWEKLKRVIRFRLYRGLKDEISDRLSFLQEEKGGVFTSHVNLGDLVFEPKDDFQRIEMSLKESGFDSASKEITKEADKSKELDQITINRMFYPLKPWRGAYEDQHQSIDNFLDLLDDNFSPALVSKKFDGFSHVVFKNGDDVKIYSDDGSDNTKYFPTVIDRIKKLETDKLIFLGEFERWNNGIHYPRASLGDVLSEDGDDSDVVVNIYEVVYFAGRDIHNKSAVARNRYAQKLEVDESTNEVPQEDTVLNLVPQYKVTDIKELGKKTRTLSNRVASEGVVLIRGQYPLTRQTDKETSVKYHKAGWVNAEILERNNLKREGLYNYQIGLPYPDRALKPAESKNGKAVIGKTFNTSMKLEPGDLLDIEFEALNKEINLDKNQFDVSFWVPTIIHEARGEEVNTVSDAIKRAKDKGIFQPRWIKDSETYYDQSLIEESVNSFDIKSTSQGEDPYMDWPEVPNEKMEHAIHAHFRGQSLHLDDRRELSEDVLIGWTIDIQRDEAINDDVESLSEAKDICSGYTLQEGNNNLKPYYGDNHAVLQEKAPEPKEWLDYEGVVEPGSVGATRFEPGVFYIMDQGVTEWGTQKPYYHEYFDSEGDIFNGIFVTRLLENVWGDSKTGKSNFVWFGWYTEDPVPYVISSRAVEKEWMPPQGYSALPQTLMKEVPEPLRYWEKGDKAKDTRDKLVDEKILTKKSCKFNKKHELIYDD